jgi:hypothetical protein
MIIETAGQGAYATDGHCHNSEPGTYNHECGRPAIWIGTDANGWQSGFCDECKRHGFEARLVIKWERRQNATNTAA